MQRVLTIGIIAFVGLIGGQAASGQDGTEDKFSRVSQMKADGDLEGAANALQAMLPDRSNEPVARRVRNELVFLFLDMGDEAEAEQVAREALLVYPDLDADVAFFPPRINDLYDRLRGELFGSLIVTTDPPDSPVLLDDKPVGNSPVRLTYVRVGRHSVTVSRSGYDEKSQDVKIKGGDESSLFINLRSDPFGWRGRVRPGIDIGVTRLLSYQGRAPDGVSFEPALGAALDVGLNAKLYLEFGLRYTRSSGEWVEGNTPVAPSSPGSPAPEPTVYRTTFDHEALTLGVLFKFFPWRQNGFFVASGPTYSIMTGREDTTAGDVTFGTSSRYALGLDLALGLERLLWGHFGYIRVQASSGVSPGVSTVPSLEIGLSVGMAFRAFGERR